jgi:2-dehydro-3-deoxy-L-fuconate 4-dehydrogenase
LSSVRLAGKSTFVTAAGRGIGRETALAFAKEGARVLATDVDVDALESLRREASAIEIQSLDVTDKSAVAEIAQARVFDVVFNCAGWVHQGTILDCTYADWRRSFEVNIDSMYFVCRAVLPAMIEAGRGSIINMSSVVSSVKGAPNRFSYGASKAAVIGLTKSIAADFAKYNIRVNAVCPGTVDTPSLGKRVAALPGKPDTIRQQFVERQPLGRLGHAAEVAALLVYLASDESAFTTGAVHVIDGGWSI